MTIQTDGASCLFASQAPLSATSCLHANCEDSPQLFVLNGIDTSTCVVPCCVVVVIYMCFSLLSRFQPVTIRDLLCDVLPGQEGQHED